MRHLYPPGIDFDDAIFLGVGVQRVLNVTFSDDTQVPNDLESSRAKHMVFIIRKGLGGGNDDRISSVCTKRVKVFHVTADDSVLRASWYSRGSRS
jgi:hypothetical protein